MITNELQAWVLHKHWLGETSALVTFFTREKGVVVARYKGGRTPKKQSQLQPFTSLWLSLDTHKDWHYVRHVEVNAPTLIFPSKNLFAGLYLNELLYYGLRPQDSHTELYLKYIETLQKLTEISDRWHLEASLRRFEWALLADMGYHMTWTHDARSGKPILEDVFYGFIVDEGFIEAQSGLSGKHILAIEANQLEKPEVLKTLKWIMRKAIHHALDGKPINARALYEDNQFQKVRNA